MKKILITLAILLMFPLVNAFYDGQTFTQTQIDNYDVSTLTKQDIDLHPTSYTILTRYSVKVYYDYLEIYPQIDGTYLVQYSHGRVIWNAEEMGEMCYNVTNPPTHQAYLDCVVNTYIPSKTDRFLNYVRHDAMYYKTGIRSYLINLLNGWI